MADEQAIDGGAAGKGDHTLRFELVTKGARAPARMGLPEFEDADLDLGRHLVRARRWPAGVIGQAGNARGGIAPQPAVDRLPGDPVSHGHVGDRGPRQHFEHGFVPLFHQSQLHKHGVCPPQIAGFLLLSGVEPEGEVLSKCHIGTGATVAQVPEPRPEWNTPTGATVSNIYRDRTTRARPGLTCRQSVAAGVKAGLAESNGRLQVLLKPAKGLEPPTC